eukprot:TRINITY_DN1824_c0_g2_i1.p1 TRINITY_DN1824_c0_g2~~TRINITY_DN1824_c0_g2_i1.p1  ORF type:complete len:148 (-),score=47.41 TRINITY_DN1824_c0_g2_i1:51-494(-)
MATDGLWNFFDSGEVIGLVRDYLREQKERKTNPIQNSDETDFHPTNASTYLIKKVLERAAAEMGQNGGSKKLGDLLKINPRSRRYFYDDTTVVVVFFQHKTQSENVSDKDGGGGAENKEKQDVKLNLPPSLQRAIKRKPQQTVIQKK